MTQFDRLVKAFVRELTDIKSAPTRSPSAMALKTRTITIYPVIVGYTSGTTALTLPSKAGVAVISLDEPGFVTVSIINDQGQRSCMQRLRSNSAGDREFLVWVQDGSPADAGELGGNTGNSKTIAVQVEVAATCDFTLTQYQTESWTS